MVLALEDRLDDGSAPLVGAGRLTGICGYDEEVAGARLRKPEGARAKALARRPLSPMEEDMILMMLCKCGD